MAAAPASASGLDSMTAACDQAAAACDAPAFPAATTATYNGDVVAVDKLPEGLSCVTADDGSLSCFDSEEQAAQATAQASIAKKRARAAADCLGTTLIVYADQYAGSAELLSARMAWYNLSYTNNEVSSYRMGDHSGHLAENFGGNGYWYPGLTGICDGNYIPAHYPSWDNRISSRYRN
ncbi:MAG: hypothetical protein ACJ76L_07685 [Conexibacter sp.]